MSIHLNKINLEELSSPGKNGRMKGCCSIVPIRSYSVTSNDKLHNDGYIKEGLTQYTLEELAIIKNQ